MRLGVQGVEEMAQLDPGGGSPGAEERSRKVKEQPDRRATGTSCVKLRSSSRTNTSYFQVTCVN